MPCRLKLHLAHRACRQLPVFMLLSLDRRPAITGSLAVYRPPLRWLRGGTWASSKISVILGSPSKIYDIFEGTEQIQQLVISRAISGLRIE